MSGALSSTTKKICYNKACLTGIGGGFGLKVLNLIRINLLLQNCSGLVTNALQLENIQAVNLNGF
jgi:hypothetical protein